MTQDEMNALFEKRARLGLPLMQGDTFCVEMYMKALEYLRLQGIERVRQF